MLTQVNELIITIRLDFMRSRYICNIYLFFFFCLFLFWFILFFFLFIFLPFLLLRMPQIAFFFVLLLSSFKYFFRSHSQQFIGFTFSLKYCCSCCCYWLSFGQFLYLIWFDIEIPFSQIDYKQTTYSLCTCC